MITAISLLLLGMDSGSLAFFFLPLPQSKTFEILHFVSNILV